MFFRRIATALQRQDWTTVVIELFIVVVGVFIGVQVSNWNAEQQELRNAQGYQARILDDILTDIGTLDGRIAYYIAVRGHLEATIAALATVASPEPELAGAAGRRFLIDAYQGTQLWQFRESSDTYTELIASGKIHLFGNTRIRSEMAQYYRETQVLLRYWLDVTDYRDIVRRYLPYDIQHMIQESCETFVPAERETRANALVADCQPPLSDADVERGVMAVLKGVDAFELSAAANRRVAQINIHLDQFARKRESAEKLIEVLENVAER